MPLEDKPDMTEDMPPQDHRRPNCFEIDLGAIAQYATNIRRLVGDRVAVFAALKCNAYGFGLVPVARTIIAAGGDGIAVVDRANAIALRQAGITAPILVYPGSLATAEAVAACERFDLIPSFTDLDSAALYSRLAGKPLNVAVKIDIGQERLGFPAEMAAEAIATIARMPRLALHIVHAHPNVPSPPSPAYLDWQLGRFEAVCRKLEGLGLAPPLRMLASSKILAMAPRLALDAVDPGQMFFGPFRKAGDVPWPTERQPFKALSSRLIHVRAVDRNAFLAEAPFPIRPGMRMGVIPIGSADGMAQLHCGAVLVRGRRAPIIGSPSLEHTRIDLTALPEAQQGDEVVIIGEQAGERITPDEVVAHQHHARIADLAMAVRPSIPRHYLGP
ncbi:MAG TPA: alanine racemase [Stellaceae bacterium]|nr:alanine racemase [Stellaceae bacterium]